MDWRDFLKSNRKKIGLITAGIIIFLVMNCIGLFSPINSFLNANPDKSCTVDSDCALKRTTCSYCYCGDAVNKNWNVLCPFNDLPFYLYGRMMCGVCPINFEIKCVNNQCKKEWVTQQYSLCRMYCQKLSNRYPSIEIVLNATIASSFCQDPDLDNSIVETCVDYIGECNVTLVDGTTVMVGCD